MYGPPSSIARGSCLTKPLKLDVNVALPMEPISSFGRASILRTWVLSN
jgi:hypothetical protein